MFLNSCRTILQESSDIGVQHIHRQANRLAHTLAKLSCLSGSVNIYYSLPPDVLEMI